MSCAALSAIVPGDPRREPFDLDGPCALQREAGGRARQGKRTRLRGITRTGEPTNGQKTREGKSASLQATGEGASGDDASPLDRIASRQDPDTTAEMPRRRANPRRVRSDARAASPLPVVNPAISKPKKNQTKSEVPCGAASVAGGNSAESRVAGTRGDEASPHRLQRDVRATRAAYRGFGYRRARVPAVTSPERTALNLGGFSLPRTQFGAVSVVEPSPFSASGA